MIVDLVTFKIRKNGANGKWKLGFINVPNTLSAKLQWKEQNLNMFLLSDEELMLPEDQLREKIDNVIKFARKQKEVNELIEKIK